MAKRLDDSFDEDLKHVSEKITHFGSGFGTLSFIRDDNDNADQARFVLNCLATTIRKYDLDDNALVKITIQDDNMRWKTLLSKSPLSLFEDEKKILELLEAVEYDDVLIIKSCDITATLPDRTAGGGGQNQPVKKKIE